MRKLMAVGLMLCILTVLVSGASAASEKNKDARVSVSLSEYAGAYITSNSDGEPSYATVITYTQPVISKKGITVKGAALVHVSGSSGSYAYSGQALSGYISR
jgi:hypothetical protein